MANQRQQELAAELGIDVNRAAEAPEYLRKQAFFHTLARHGITPSTDREAEDLLNASIVLEQKRAEFQAANNPVNKTLQILLKKSASAPASGGASDSVVRDQREISKEASAHMDAMLQDPSTLAALLVACS